MSNAEVDRIIARTGVDRKDGIVFYRTDEGGFILYESGKEGTQEGKIVGVEAYNDGTFYVGGGRYRHQTHLDIDTAVRELNKAVTRYKNKNFMIAITLAGVGLVFVFFLFLLFKACG